MPPFGTHSPDKFVPGVTHLIPASGRRVVTETGVDYAWQERRWNVETTAPFEHLRSEFG